MGHTNSTPNLNLPQFVGSDKPTWLSDVNGAMLAIDNAYGTIEAQASSAATAAAGAVTVAGAAQTAAESAASAAAAAGTNASEALSTANNAATVALQAQSDSEESLEIATGKIAASVTADGVKTYAQLLNEIYAAVPASNVTPKSKLKIGAAVLSITRIESNSYALTNTHLTSALVVSDATVSENSVYRTASITNTPSVTFYDQSDTVVTSGTVIALYL